MSIRKLHRIEVFSIIIWGLSSLMILYLLSPILALFISVDPATLAEILGENKALSPDFYNAVLTTFIAAFTSATILMILGVPVAFILVRKNFPGKAIVESIIDIPIVIPHPVVGILLLITYSENGLMGSIVSRLGLKIIDSFWGVVLAFMYVSAPLLIDTVKLGIQKIDPMNEYVAYSLGASKRRVFLDILLPLIVPNIIAGYILALARSLSEVGSLLILAYYPTTLNILVIDWFHMFGLRYALALSFILVLLSLAVFTIIKAVKKY